MERLVFPRSTPVPAGTDIFLEMAKMRVESYNKTAGAEDGTGIACPECSNRELIAFLNDNGDFQVRPCKCQGHRKTIRRLQAQGLYKRAQKQTLDAYMTDTPTRAALKQMTERFIADTEPHWLAFCGQPGTGKTHLATAAFAQLSYQRGLAGRYLVWPSDARRLKTALVEGDERQLMEYKTAELLYIDDALKTKRGVDPSDADVRLLFELLDYRYTHSLVTIISCERRLEDLRALDEAIYRRIHEMAGPYVSSIDYDIAKIYIPIQQ